MHEKRQEFESQRSAYLRMFLAATALVSVVYFSELQPLEDIVVFGLEQVGEGASAIKG